MICFFTESHETHRLDSKVAIYDHKINLAFKVLEIVRRETPALASELSDL